VGIREQENVHAGKRNLESPSSPPKDEFNTL